MHQYTVDSLSVQNAVYEYKCSVCSVSDAMRSVYQVLCRASDYASRGHRQTRDQPAEGRRGSDRSPTGPPSPLNSDLATESGPPRSSSSSSRSCPRCWRHGSNSLSSTAAAQRPHKIRLHVLSVVADASEAGRLPTDGIIGHLLSSEPLGLPHILERVNRDYLLRPGPPARSGNARSHRHRQTNPASSLAKEPKAANKTYLCGGNGVEETAEEAKSLSRPPGASPVKATRKRDDQRGLRDRYRCKPRKVGVNPQLQRKHQYDYQIKQNIE
ncbi:hypothetical protein CsSME_00030327 [Camellia sinensis var. sinensis]